MESEELRLYYSVDNSRVYQEKEAQFLELTEEVLVAVLSVGHFLRGTYRKLWGLNSLPTPTQSTLRLKIFHWKIQKKGSVKNCTSV